MIKNEDLQKKEELLPKNFNDLIKDVHQKGICGECGGCVSFCSAAEIKAIYMPKSGPPQYFNEENCLKCGICYLICPQTHVLTDELNSKFNYKFSIGNWIKITSAKSSNENILKNSTDGGVVTSLLTYLLDKKLIKGAIVSKKIAPFNRIPYFAKSREELIESAGSHFDTSQGVINLEKYNSFVPSISSIKSIVSSEDIEIAFVGTPCQVNSIRKMQQLNIIPAHIIKYVFGLFCYVNFSFNDEKRKLIESKFNLTLDKIAKINVKENVILNLVNNDIRYLDFKDLYDITRPACMACNDFSNIYADISFGGLGSNDGFTTNIIRTKIGEEIYNKALAEKYIIEPYELNSSIKKSEMLAKVISFHKRKIDRYNKFFNII